LKDKRVQKGRWPEKERGAVQGKKREKNEEITGSRGNTC